MKKNNISLFDDFKRTDGARASHTSSAYDFLNKSAWKAASYVRDKVTEWACDFPIDKDFVARFTSRDDNEHAGAFFELITFQLLRHHGYKFSFKTN